MNHKDIIYPEKYDGHPDTGFDIAFIGLDEKNIEDLENYYNDLEKYNI